MIEPTDEMVQAFCDAEAMDPARTRDGLATVLAIVERDYLLVRKHGRPACTCDGSGRPCQRHGVQL